MSNTAQEAAAIKVLVVDDNKIYRDAFRRNLVLQNYEVIEAENTPDALERIQQNSPDIIITDLQMTTETEGLDLIRQVRSAYPLLPIIMISAVGTFEEGALAQKYGAVSVISKSRIEEDIQRALARRVDLKSGGYLIIDQTEALTTIDVNTGGFVGARNFDDTIFKTNLEAALAIGRQLRLRNLGGIIIVDFIDMTREEHKTAVLAEFRKQLSRDRTKVTVGGFTQLGLVEMTRKRTRESLARMLCEPCPTCEGRGQVKTARSVCYDILREILREARQFSPKEFRVVAAANVVEMMLDEESAHLAGLSDFIGKPISLTAEPTNQSEHYDIVLL